ncbi:hypothetical protein KY290_000869 [Solanum tuberosum]|uniref:Reverse transcriptase zinc-binding domain-containing protein n=1 Tax=Solanum tuberosum TaxID=4113 RepID=A0ABQ7WKJ1_SOLTU|nr:hypothetical protein KY289_000929 [Solanum tuberosum]KAH0781271.1 hypothetical protein KY290_000869 [Solanum tuberosum]
MGCEKDPRDGKFLRNMVTQGDTTTKLNTVVVGVCWKNIALQPNIHPRHKFILWSAGWKRLVTVAQFGIQKNVELDGITRPVGSWHTELAWANSWASKKTGIGTITNCVFAMVVYVIWRQRNARRFQKSAFQCGRICKEIGLNIHVRGRDLQKIWRQRNARRFQKSAFHCGRICKEIGLHIHVRGRDLQKWTEPLPKLNKIP